MLNIQVQMLHVKHCSSETFTLCRVNSEIVVPREGSRRRCIEGASRYFIAEQKSTSVVSQHENTRGVKGIDISMVKGTHNSRYPGGTVKICARAKQYPQPVVPCVNDVP